MKRILSIIIILVLLPGVVSYAANVGDVAGDVYPTDIKTYLFDYEINSYNIGGRTVIICEDLGWYYMFYVEWKADERRLELTDDMRKRRGYIEDIESAEQRHIGQWIANRPKDYFDTPAPEHIYHTDIVTTLDGREINSYNVNGRTAIVVEDLRDFGYDVIWDEEERTLNVYERFENVATETDIGTGYISGEPEGNKTNWEYLVYGPQTTEKIVTADGELEVNTLPSNYFYDKMYPLKETFDFLNVKFSFENNILTIDSSEAKPFEIVSTDKTHNDRGDAKINLLYVDKVIYNGVEEDNVSYKYISGHFDRMGEGWGEAPPYILNGKVYINSSFIWKILKSE